MGYYLGIDLGTSSVRALLMKSEGNVVAVASGEYPVHIPVSNWAEQDPNEWWTSTCHAIKEVIKKSSVTPDDIKAVGLSGQMHGLVLLGKNGDVIRNAIIWLDKRTSDQCQEIRQKIPEDELYRITGNPLSTGIFGPTLLWIKQFEPHSYERIYKAILPKDYIRYKLTGCIATDPTDASGTLLFDLEKRDWSSKIIKVLDLNKEILPMVLETSEFAGKTTDDCEEETGIHPRTVVITGGADQIIASIGNGAIEPGVAAIVLGTGGQLITTTNQLIIDNNRRIHTFCHVEKDSWLVMGATLAGGLSLRWYKETFGYIEELCSQFCDKSPFDLLSAQAMKANPGSNQLIFLPYLSGERTPHMDHMAKSCFIGLTLEHNRSHIVRSIMEGVVYSLKDCLNVFYEIGVPVEKLLSSGGWAKSIVWRQIQSDILELPLHSIKNNEHSSYGAALLAAVACGEYKDIKEACHRNVSYEDTLYPLKENIEIYKKLYRIYQSLYPLLKNVFKELHS
ncbi:xylulokinase [Neobacillus sp. B4I6]|uniref:xylulokinase n=1 Tax=Neobacillus sp. B4I6 TaxID=3373925 RepID=UPI003D24448D